jgi:RES domain
VAYVAPIVYSATHRLIPTKYSEGSVLETLNLHAEALADLSELDSATNERKNAERGWEPAIGPGELLFGVPEAQIVNAAFCHPGPWGGRFNDSRRGAWYAGVELETSQAEAGYHRALFLKEARIGELLSFDYQDFLADFSEEFHHLDLDTGERESCLQEEPIPQCYGPGQVLARALLNGGSNGIVYPSVRRRGYLCIACFRPALVSHPRRGQQYRLNYQISSTSWELIDP